MPGSLDATAAEYYRVPKKMGKGAYLTIFDGKSPPRHENLNRIFASTQSPLVLGRQDTDRTQHIDIELSSYLISRLHGHFIKDINGRWKIQIQESVKYALFVNNVRMEERILEDGDELKIDDFANPSDSGVLILFSMKPAETWKECKLGDKDVVIGRNPEKSDICLEHISVSKKHAVIKHNGGNRVLVDARSNSGVIVNGKRVASCMLYERDVIRITNTKLIYYKNMIRYSTSVSGASIEATGLWQVGRKKKRFSLLTMFAKKNIIMQDVSLRIEPGELVAIIGGSGAGKSTLIYMLCGLKKPNQGQVSVSGLDLYSNFDALKTQIGYVPQSDIVQDNLKFKDMLSYSARIRLPGATPKEREKRIRKAIKAVDMGKHVNKYISDFSGGQKKRASIAIELLADPKLFFLDEPASGLDPYTEETLMKTLKNMADSGKTVVFVTHSPLSLRSCDKIVFIGAGGRLCFYGSYEQAIRFLFEDEVRNGTIKNPKDFDANRLVRIYEKITADSQEISEKFKMRTSGPPRPRKEEEKSPSKKRYAKSGTKTKFFSQAVILFQRNIALFLNDTGKVASVFVLSLVLAVFVTKVENGLQYTAYGITKSLYFALTCAAFFLGCMNAITEVCKERNLVKREYMTTLSLGAYILSKSVVMALLCAIQSLLFAGMFYLNVGLPEEELLFEPFWEITLTVFMTLLSGASIGMLVSCLSKNEDQAAKFAPILLIPQLLFSGVIFDLGTPFLKNISYVVTARYAMEVFGSFANLNLLDVVTTDGIHIPREDEEIFTFTAEHINDTLIKMILFVLAYCILSAILLRRIKKADD